ncbi:hypothetical protein B0A50_06623 [Salinomyces thailandicus]|uniref:Uncharacterized protein n=1 Tax=Salinomyces thailandicus TaxID=706561 RepID=A0A4U0TRC8_9PEZI|nr:hypothetical protein B0A50_06623 [Salinomyces thailandica]
MLSPQPERKTPKPTPTIRAFQGEPLFWQGYESEEEVSSPVADDDISIHSTDSLNGRASLESEGCPPYVAQPYVGTARQVGRARAATIVLAGRAKVVDMPKLDVSAVPCMSRLEETPSRPSVSLVSRMETSSHTSSQSTQKTSPSPSSPRSPPTAHSSVPELSRRTNDIGHRPRLSALASEARAEPSTLQSAADRQQYTAELIEHDPSPSLSADPPTSPLRRRLNRVSSSLGLNVFTKPYTKRVDSPDIHHTNINSKITNGTINDLDQVHQPKPLILHSPEPGATFLPNSMSPNPPKLVPRGASERAAVLELPPFPDD